MPPPVPKPICFPTLGLEEAAKGDADAIAICRSWLMRIWNIMVGVRVGSSQLVVDSRSRDRHIGGGLSARIQYEANTDAARHLLAQTLLSLLEKLLNMLISSN